MQPTCPLPSSAQPALISLSCFAPMLFTSHGLPLFYLIKSSPHILSLPCLLSESILCHPVCFTQASSSVALKWNSITSTKESHSHLARLSSPSLGPLQCLQLHPKTPSAFLDRTQNRGLVRRAMLLPIASQHGTVSPDGTPQNSSRQQGTFPSGACSTANIYKMYPLACPYVRPPSFKSPRCLPHPV